MPASPERKLGGLRRDQRESLLNNAIRRMKARIERRDLMRRLFRRDGDFTGDGRKFFDHLFDAANMSKVHLEADAAAQAYYMGRLSLAREIFAWCDISEATMMEYRQMLNQKGQIDD